MPIQTTSRPRTASSADRLLPLRADGRARIRRPVSQPGPGLDPVTRPENESSDGRSSAPVVALVATVALSYSFLAGTVVGQVI